MKCSSRVLQLKENNCRNPTCMPWQSTKTQQARKPLIIGLYRAAVTICKFQLYTLIWTNRMWFCSHRTKISSPYCRQNRLRHRLYQRRRPLRSQSSSLSKVNHSCLIWMQTMDQPVRVLSKNSTTKDSRRQRLLSKLTAKIPFSKTIQGIFTTTASKLSYQISFEL